jgi:hypothetical protein
MDAWSSVASEFPNVGLEDEFSFAIWLLSGLIATWMLWAGTGWLAPFLYSPDISQVSALDGNARCPLPNSSALLRSSAWLLPAWHCKLRSVGSIVIRTPS